MLTCCKALKPAGRTKRRAHKAQVGEQQGSSAHPQSWAANLKPLEKVASVGTAQQVED
jgi:hypothetical protein